MATIRTGSRAALVVVDTQVGVVATAHERDAVVARIGTLVERARSGGVPVLWVQHNGEELVPGTDAWKIVPELTPSPEEAIVPKKYNSSFQQTELDGLLALSEISHVVLCGAATNWCIRATAFSALERGFDLTLAADAHTTESIALGPNRTITADDIIAELNIGLNWVDYPGVSNQVCPASEIRFEAGFAITPPK